jgi:hypothetical protein
MTAESSSFFGICQALSRTFSDTVIAVAKATNALCSLIVRALLRRWFCPFSVGLGILEGGATVEIQAGNRIIGAIEDLQPVEAGKVELPQPVAGTIEDAQGVKPPNIKAGELIIVGVKALEFGKAVEG